MKKVIQAIPTEIFEENGKFRFRLETNKKGVIVSQKKYNSETQALSAAEKTIEYYWYVGH